MEPVYGAPRSSDVEATPHSVREELANCLMTAFGSVQRVPHAAPNPIQLRNDVDRFMRRAVEDAGHDYDRPTQAGLQAVIDEWRRQGGAFITDAQKIQHHWNEMNKIVSRLA